MGSAHCTTHGARNRAWRRQQRDRYIAKRHRHRLNCGTTWLKGFGHIHQDTNISHLGQLSKSKALSPHKGFLGDSRASWKLLGQRAHKLARAKQLKMPYPYRVWLNEVELEAEFQP